MKDDRPITAGECRCIVEPRGKHNLEGYNHDQHYRFVQCKDAKGAYYRVYPGAANDACSEYYECCSVRVFDKHFSILAAHSLASTPGR